MKSSLFAGLLGATAITVSLAGTAQAIDTMPGDYAWLGHGTNLVLGYAQVSTAHSLLTENGEVPDSQLNMTVALLRGLAFREIGGQKFSFQAILPMGQFTEARIGGQTQNVKDGLGDLTLGATWYPVASNDPTGTTMGLSLFVTAPTGAYDAAQTSFGSGTWTLTPQLGVVQGLGNGFFLDVTADVAIRKDHTENGADISRDNSSQLQAYVRYQPTEQTSFSFGYSGTFDGKGYKDGVYNNTKTRVDTVKFFASTFLDASTQAQLMVAKDVDAEDGFQNDTVAQIRLLKLF